MKTVEGLFRIPFDRDGRLYPDEADGWTDEQFDAFHAGIEAGIAVVRYRYENPDEWHRSSLKAGWPDRGRMTDEPTYREAS